MALKLTWNDIFTKLMGGMLVGMFGIVLGYFTGSIFETIAVYNGLPWIEFLSFIGGIGGFLLGTQIE